MPSKERKQWRGAFALLLFLISSIACGGTQEAAKDKGSCAIEGDVFPVNFQEGLYHLTEGFPGILAFTFRGDPDLVKEASLILDVPDGLTCLGACPYWKKGIWTAEKMISRPVTRENAPYRRYEIVLDEGIIRRLQKSSWRWWDYERVYIENLPGCANTEAIVYWKITSGTFEGTEKRFLVKLLSPLIAPEKKAKQFQLMICHLGSQNVPFPGVREAYSGYWKSLQERPCTLDQIGWNRTNEEIRSPLVKDFRTVIWAGNDNGMPMIYPDLFFPLWWKKTKGEELPAIPRAEHGIDKSSSFCLQPCPCAVLDDEEGLIWNDFVPSAISSAIENIPGTVAVAYDYEPGTDQCYCGTCRERFMEFQGLEDTPGVEEVKTRYKKQWFQFKVMQHGLLSQRFSRCVKNHFPDIQFWICTDPLHTSGGLLREWCGTDERIFDADADLHLPMPYYSGLSFLKDMDFNVRKLQKPVFPLNDPSEKLLMFFSRYTPAKVRQNIIAAAAVGCTGFGFWPDDILDGLYLTKISEGFSLVAKAEDYYMNRRDDDLATVKPVPLVEKTIKDEGKELTISIPSFGEKLQFTVHQNGLSYLVTLINYDDGNDAVVEVRMPGISGELYRVREVGSGCYYVHADKTPLAGKDVRNGFLTRVEKNSVRLLEIKRSKNTVPLQNSISQEDFHKELETMKREHEISHSFPEAKEGTAVVSWGDIDDNGRPDLKMQLDNWKIYIDMNSAAPVISWMRDGAPQSDLLYSGDRGFLGNLLLHGEPEALKKCPFRLQSVAVRNGTPMAVFLTTFVREEGGNPLPHVLNGLTMKKTVILERQGGQIRSIFSFVNDSPSRKDIPFGVRINNFPRLGGIHAKAVGESLSTASRIVFQTSAGESSCAPATKKNAVWLAKGCSSPEFLKQYVQPGDWTVSPIHIRIGSEDLIVEPDPKNTAGFYVWSDMNHFTVEPLSPEITLKPGESFTYEYVVTYDRASPGDSFME